MVSYLDVLVVVGSCVVAFVAETLVVETFVAVDSLDCVETHVAYHWEQYQYPNWLTSYAFGAFLVVFLAYSAYFEDFGYLANSLEARNWHLMGQNTNWLEMTIMRITKYVIHNC